MYVAVTEPVQTTPVVAPTLAAPTVAARAAPDNSEHDATPTPKMTASRAPKPSGDLDPDRSTRRKLLLSRSALKARQGFSPSAGSSSDWLGIRGVLALASEV